MHIRTVLWAAFGLFLMGYFLFHTVEGKRGVFVLQNLNQDIQKSEQQLAKLEEKRKSLEFVAVSLRSDQIDPDILDEKIRQNLGYVRLGESIIITQ